MSKFDNTFKRLIEQVTLNPFDATIPKSEMEKGLEPGTEIVPGNRLANGDNVVVAYNPKGVPIFGRAQIVTDRSGERQNAIHLNKLNFVKQKIETLETYEYRDPREVSSLHFIRRKEKR